MLKMILVSMVLFSISVYIHADDEKLNYTPFNRLKPAKQLHDIDMKTCKKENMALVTVFSINGLARQEIEVKVDGDPVGKLTTYYPDDTPDCQTPTAKGVITIKVPAGKHTLDAESPNITWPGHTFTAPACDCVLLPLT